MTVPNAFDPKWLFDVELLDTKLDAVEDKEPSHILSFFHSLTDELSRQKLTAGVLGSVSNALEDAVPWFLKNMPPLYLFSTTQKSLSEDILTLIAGNVLFEPKVMEGYRSDSQSVTVIASGKEGNPVVRMAQFLANHQAKILRMFTSLDKKIGLCEIYKSPYNIGGDTARAQHESKLASLEKSLAAHPVDEVRKIADSFDADYVALASSRQMGIAVEAVLYCTDNENSYVQMQPIFDEISKKHFIRVDLGLKNFPVTAAVEHVIGIFNRYSFDIERILANEVRLNEHETHTVIHLIAASSTAEQVLESGKNWGKTLKSLKALSYVDHSDEFAALLLGESPYSINESNLVRAFANWTHIFLTKQNPYYYSLDRVSKVVLSYPGFIELSIQYFRARFDLRFQGDRKKTSDDLEKKLQDLIQETFDPVERKVLQQCLNFLKHILKTNYFLVSKGALTFRMDPNCLDSSDYPESPFGIFYMIGRNFRAFQVRYRDISRGGMRIVIPRTSGDYDNALAGLFDEVNGLAFAQQLKNKDIPEGGSKCVMVLKPGANKNDAVKAAVSGLLDLVQTDLETGKLNKDIIDYYAKEEIIYLGPDENLTDDLIVWITKHAVRRKYKYAYAFMSSKPDFGINHKTYGVTSEGLNVYVDNVLHSLNLQSSTFRVKMTGGPDGDVAGNEMNILYREYGERCRLVAVADGFGAAYDPNGLAWPEILRLFRESKSIVAFDPKFLSADPKSFVIAADTKENMKIRDNLYATVEAEIFIPGGGRPYTVKESNWDKYLLFDRRPSSRAIVEGANIFFTKEARQKLVDSGIIVIKDSSANKAGVSCSSYEIIACLTILPEEFAPIKDIYVKQVLGIIRQNADKEAKLLFREWQKNKLNTDLVKLSYEISAEINFANDILLEKLNTLKDEELVADEFNYILFKHCPPILVEKYPERILQRLPRAHKIAVISAYMASHLVYKEGLNWLDAMHPDQIFSIALQYMKAEQTIEKIVSQVEVSDLPHKEEIMQILLYAGAKHLASNCY